jgi:hypothetical protein
MAQTASGYTAIHYMSSEYKLSGFDWKDDPSIRERFRHHRRKHHYAHGYHPMVAIADIVGADRKSHRQRDNLEEASERKTGKSHRSRRSSKSRAKPTDEVGLVVLPEDDDDMQRLNTRGTNMWASPSLPCLRSLSFGSCSYLLYAGCTACITRLDLRSCFLPNQSETHRSASTKASKDLDLDWIQQQRLRFEKRAANENAARYSDDES